MSKIIQPKEGIIASLGYRIGLYHAAAQVQIGRGNPNADVIVVQPAAKMPDRDAVTGALKNFGMLNDAYRATSMIVDSPDSKPEINRYYLKELIEIVRPLVVVACGEDVVSMLRNKKARSFKTYSGKKFRVSDLTSCIFYATINPVDYGFARAPQALKAQGKEEWTKLSELYAELKEKQEKERWGL